MDRDRISVDKIVSIGGKTWLFSAISLVSCPDDGDELPLAGELLAPGLVAVDAVEAQVGFDEDGVLDDDVVFVGEDWAHGGRDGEDELLDGLALCGCKPVTAYRSLGSVGDDDLLMAASTACGTNDLVPGCRSTTISAVPAIPSRESCSCTFSRSATNLYDGHITLGVADVLLGGADLPPVLVDSDDDAGLILDP